MDFKIDPKYGEVDADVKAFLWLFDERPGTPILSIGDNEEYSANILTDNGYGVTGMDLRPWLQSVPCNHVHLTQDLMEFARHADGLTPPSPMLDCVYSLSAVEHFGLTTYGDRDFEYQDAVAMDAIWRILRHSGTCYVTVPYGRYFMSCGTHWRIYDQRALHSRIVQKFKVEKVAFFTSAIAHINQTACPLGTELDKATADTYEGTDPHVTVILKMRKDIYARRRQDVLIDRR